MSLAMIFIAALFPAGVHFTTISTERTIAAVAADEAFAKIKLYGTDPNLSTTCSLFPGDMPSSGLKSEMLYPSDPCIPDASKQYCWSAIWRHIPDTRYLDQENVQVTVFVSRKTGLNTIYYLPMGNPVIVIPGPSGHGPCPIPVMVNVTDGSELLTLIDSDQTKFFTDGCTLVDGATGLIYRVLSRETGELTLDKPFIGSGQRDVWVVPPPVGGGRAPCISVFQRIVRF